MLQIITSPGQENMHQLLSVYAESNAAHGASLLPNGSCWEQLRLGEEMFRESVFAFLRINGAALALWSDSGRCNSALRLEPYLDGLLLSCLETAPEDRGKGAAAALLDAVLENSRCKIYSHVHKDNTISLKLHLNAGFSVFSDYSSLLDGTVTHSYYTLIHEY